MPPATRANRAAVEAPKLKPLRSCRASASPAPAASAASRRTWKAAARPPRPTATTTKPMTDPAVKATWSPSLRVPTAQATVVRTLACVATIMPHHPARALSVAPDTKATATSIPSEGPTTGLLVKSIQRTAASASTKAAICRYSSRRKAMEPERIWPARSSISRLPMRAPVGLASSRRCSTRTKSRQTKDTAMAGRTASLERTPAMALNDARGAAPCG
mmetsp:Transcript_4023/g.11628  ORF Transcript_4023/g.11628 Transcript_4023/m.11628 type:complete len:218 (+) Transcript_4023:1978-2631(+)